MWVIDIQSLCPRKIFNFCFGTACFTSCKINYADSNQNPDTVFDFVYKYFEAVLWNIMLVGVFVLQHSGMASDWWKFATQCFRKFGIERPLYVCATNTCLLLLVNNWCVVYVSPLWYIDTSERFWLWLFFAALHTVAWICIYGALLCADISELIGYTEFYNYWNGIRIPSSEEWPFLRLLMHMRHPGAFCLLLILWIHPLMTWQRFICSLSLTLYLLFGFRVTDDDYVYTKQCWYSKSWFVVEKVHRTKVQ